MGRFRRSLYVGRITEYLSLAAAFVGAIVTEFAGCKRGRRNESCSLERQVAHGRSGGQLKERWGSWAGTMRCKRWHELVMEEKRRREGCQACS